VITGIVSIQAPGGRGPMTDQVVGSPG